MNTSQQRLAMYLAFAGILPPWLGLMIHLTGLVPWADFASLTYGAVIASFVCGMHWGLYLHSIKPIPTNLLITSNVGALAAWALVLVSLWSMAIAFAGLAIVLGLLLLIDRVLEQAGVIEPWFYNIRRIASAGLGAGLLAWSILA